MTLLVMADLSCHIIVKEYGKEKVSRLLGGIAYRAAQILWGQGVVTTLTKRSVLSSTPVETRKSV
jgi:hypothetical protein